MGCAFTACLQRKQKQVALKEQHLEVCLLVDMSFTGVELRVGKSIHKFPF